MAFSSACRPRTAALCSSAAGQRAVNVLACHPNADVLMTPVASATKLRRRAEFARVYERGSRWRGRLLTGFALRNGLAGPRLGIAASGKVGNAVARNRAKRRVRELFRFRKPLISIDLIVVPVSESVKAPWPELKADYTNLLRRIEKALETPISAELLSK
jgi:ribonuclease P protein component